MRVTVRSLALVVSAAVLLGCSGVWQQAMGDTIRQEVTEMRVLLANVAPGPEADQLAAILDSVEIEAYSGDIGVVEIANFRVALEDAVYDGAIDAGELAAVQAAHDHMMAP